MRSDRASLTLLCSAFLVGPSLASETRSPSAAVPAPTPGTGVVWGDVDGDRLPDLLTLLPDGSLRLMQNTGDGGLTEVTERAGLGALSGVRVALFEDLDGDGLADLFVGGAEGGRFFANAQGTFLESSAGSGLEGLVDVRSAQTLDYDADGRVDLFVVTAVASHVLHGREGGFEGVLETPIGAGSAGTLGRPNLPQAPGDDTSISGTGSRGGADRGGAPRTRTSGGAATRDESGGRGPVDPSSRPGSGEAGSGFGPLCLPGIFDQSGGACIEASRSPMLGKLFPMDAFLNVAPSGAVGIGTTDPAARLNVQGGGDASLGGGGFLVNGNVAGSNLILDTNEIMARNAGAATTLFLNADGGDVIVSGNEGPSGGNVGIGSSASHKLTVASDDEETMRLIGPDSFGHGARLNFGDADFAFIEEDADDDLHIFANGRTALTGGPVGIGTLDPDPTFALDVGGGAHVDGPLRVDSFANFENFVNIDGGPGAYDLVVHGGALFTEGLQVGPLGDQMSVPRAPETLDMIRGTVLSDGSVILGAGFTVTKTGTGAYTVNFNDTFGGNPTFVATPFTFSSDDNVINVTNLGVQGVNLHTLDVDDGFQDMGFNFIAIGPRS